MSDVNEVLELSNKLTLLKNELTSQYKKDNEIREVIGKILHAFNSHIMFLIKMNK